MAIIDVGIDLDHPDLAPNLWVNTKEIAGNGVDDDGNGFIDDVNGYDFAGRCSSTDITTGLCTGCSGQAAPYGDSRVNTGEYFHGTHAAGLVGAVQGNGLGITGISPGVKLMILKVRMGGGFSPQCICLSSRVFTL